MQQELLNVCHLEIIEIILLILKLFVDFGQYREPNTQWTFKRLCSAKNSGSY